jgi:branched-chain amino acid transport system permease protein
MRRALAGKVILIVAAAVIVAVLPFLLSDYHQGLGADVAVYVMAILGLNILTGYTGQISIGHGAFMAIGGYTTAILSHDHNVNLVATLPISFVLTFACGVLVGLPALRLSGVYLALATFALAVSVPQFPLEFSKFTGGSNGISTSHSVSETWLYGMAWASAAVLYVVAWLVLRGRTGRAFRAIRDSEVAATSSGVALPIYKTLAFGISAAFAGVAGSFFVLATNGFAQPNEFTLFLSLELLIGAAVAGLGSLWGVPIGAMFIALLPTISASAPVIGTAHGQDLVFGLAVILVILLLPTGVAGLAGANFRPRPTSWIRNRS